MRTVSNQPYSELGLLAQAGVRRNNSALVVETVGANQSAMSVGLHECGARIAVVAKVGSDSGFIKTDGPVEYEESPAGIMTPGQIGLIRAVYALNVDHNGKLVVSAPIAWTSRPLPNAILEDVNWNGATENIMAQHGVANTRDLFIGPKGKVRVSFGVVPAGFGMELPADHAFYADLLVRDHAAQEVTLAQ